MYYWEQEVSDGEITKKVKRNVKAITRVTNLKKRDYAV